MDSTAISGLALMAERRVSYLRISVTDRCNERCCYCIPARRYRQLSRAEVLTYEEILAVAAAAVDLGIDTFRITGGEPLVRRDLVGLVARLRRLPGCRKVAMTTNATRLAPLAAALRDAGLDGVNVSLDTLDADRYRAITRTGDLDLAMAGLAAALEARFASVKINAVLMRGRNDDELPRLVEFAREQGIPIRFIELMPLGRWQVLAPERFLSIGQARRLLERHYALRPVEERVGDGPARYVRTDDGQLIGFIGALSDPHFCERCNKLRLTADGKLRPCLGSGLEFDLKPHLRGGGTRTDLQAVLRQAAAAKPAAHEFLAHYRPDRRMAAIGG